MAPTPDAPTAPANRKHRKAWWWIALGTSAAVLLCCGGGLLVVGLYNGDETATPIGSAQADNPQENKPPTIGDGETLRAHDRIGDNGQADITVTELKLDVTSGNQFVQPSHEQFIATKVTIAGAEGQVDFGPSNFRLIGPDGTICNSAFVFNVVENQLETLTTVRAGQKKVGWVVFDCPPGDFSNSQVEMETDLGEVIGYWQM